VIGFPFFKAQIDGWFEGKKHDLIMAIEEEFLEYKNQNKFQTDRHLKRDYHKVFDSVVSNQFAQFSKKSEISFELKDLWTVRYNTNDFHVPHNHGSTGLSGILYLVKESEHPSTQFLLPWNNIKHGATQIYTPDTIEGDIIIFPSFLTHWTEPNVSEISRVAVSFDLRIL